MTAASILVASRARVSTIVRSGTSSLARRPPVASRGCVGSRFSAAAWAARASWTRSRARPGRRRSRRWGTSGDDVEILGLHVSPDLDTVLYTLAGLLDEERGWGVRDESYAALDQVRALGGETWFTLGDRDIGLHLVRTEALRRGAPLSATFARLAEALGVGRAAPAGDGRSAAHAAHDGGRRARLPDLVRAAPPRRRGARRRVRRSGGGAAGARRARGDPRRRGRCSSRRRTRSSRSSRSWPCPAWPRPSPSTSASSRSRRSSAGGRCAGRSRRCSPRSGTRRARPAWRGSTRGSPSSFVLDPEDAALAPEIEALGLRAIVAPIVMADPATRESVGRAILDAL